MRVRPSPQTYLSMFVLCTSFPKNAHQLGPCIVHIIHLFIFNLFIQFIQTVPHVKFWLRDGSLWVSSMDFIEAISPDSSAPTFPSLSYFSLATPALVMYWSIGARNISVNKEELACVEEGIWAF